MKKKMMDFDYYEECLTSISNKILLWLCYSHYSWCLYHYLKINWVFKGLRKSKTYWSTGAGQETDSDRPPTLEMSLPQMGRFTMYFGVFYIILPWKNSKRYELFTSFKICFFSFKKIFVKIKV